tara:strand:- start:8201 stop:9307 length:1107 start_codon:yes stop_codon:yes gene_type:complete
MTKKYGIPLMITKPALEAMFNSDFEERDLSSYVTQLSNNTVMLKIHGPLMRHGDFWSELFGISAYSSITKEFKRLIKEPSIKNIILDIDSPGGMVNGCAELAELIYRARDEKNIISYISGMGCSAAYYIASAAQTVYAHKMSSVGSIGVVACFEKSTDENTKTIEIVSSKSKDKRLDPETEEGKNKIQSEVDDLADIFANDIARYRDISLENVEKTNGGTFIGQKALEMKLVDEISDLETILEEFEMSENQTSTVTEENSVATASKVDVQAAVKAERERFSAISAKAKELGLPEMGEKLVDMGMDVESAEAVLASGKKDLDASKEGPSIMPTDFEKAMAKVENPQVEAKDKTQNNVSDEVDAYFADEA